jgi:hypothetical protein
MHIATDHGAYSLGLKFSGGNPAPPYAGAVMVSERIPGCRLVSFESGGHLLIGHDKEIRNAIRSFIVQ